MCPLINTARFSNVVRVGQALERDKKLCAALAEIRASDGIRTVEERMQVRTMPCAHFVFVS